MENSKQIFTTKDVNGKEQRYTVNELGQLIPLIEVKDKTPIKSAYTPSEGMKLLGISRNSFMNLLYSGQLKGVKAGRRWLISSQAIENFLNPSN